MGTVDVENDDNRLKLLLLGAAGLALFALFAYLVFAGRGDLPPGELNDQIAALEKTLPTDWTNVVRETTSDRVCVVSCDQIKSVWVNINFTNASLAKLEQWDGGLTQTQSPCQQTLASWEQWGDDNVVKSCGYQANDKVDVHYELVSTAEKRELFVRLYADNNETWESKTR